MPKAPKHMRAPGPVRAFFGADRTKRAVVAALVVVACWAANEYVIWPQRGPWWAPLVLGGIMLLHLTRLYVELRDGLRHAEQLSSIRSQLRQIEMLARNAQACGDPQVETNCEARARHLSERYDFHLLGLRGELPLDKDVP